VFHRLIFRLIGLLALSCAAFAQQFTADMVHSKPQSDVVTKVYVREDKMRLETTSQEHSGVAIVNLEQRTSLMLVPASKTYVASRAPSATPFFRPADADNACEAWEKFVSKPGTCTKVGEETVNGRSTVKYKGTAPNGDTGFAWVDRQLKFVTKWEGEKTAVEFQNIKEGPQQASLFAVPSDYEKIDVPQPHKGKPKTAKPRVVLPPQTPKP
jgi:hypothetical protein